MFGADDPTTARLCATALSDPPAVETLRDLARHGALATAAASASSDERAMLTGAAYDIAWPVVFTRLTRRLERQRGHRSCAASAQRLADDCLDRFYDDVEAVVAYLLAHANQRIHDLEGWIASRLLAATVDGHRRRRGERGALQRPRVPKWLVSKLRDDPWLTELAKEILVWAGVSTTAGMGTWPLDGWAQRRAAVTGEWRESEPATVAHEVDAVLAAMRSRPAWYLAHVETPLGHKQLPVAPTADVAGRIPEQRGAPSTRSGDARLNELADVAVTEISQRIRAGDDPETVVVEVIGCVFGDGGAEHDLDCPPHGSPTYDEWAAVLVHDPAAVRRIVRTALEAC